MTRRTRVSATSPPPAERPAAAARIGIFDLFTVGIGPSSSHTVGPMRAARMFAGVLADGGELGRVAGLRVELHGSLAATGRGHGTWGALLAGLAGERPEHIDPEAVGAIVADVAARGSLSLLGEHPVAFDPERDIVAHRRRRLPGHVNGMRFSALDATGAPLARRDYYSIGGGFVREGDGDGLAPGPGPGPGPGEAAIPEPLPFTDGAGLLRAAGAGGLSISGVMLANETATCPEAVLRERVMHLWSVMQQCVARGCAQTGTLPGGLEVRRRAPALYESLTAQDAATGDPMLGIEWVGLWAIAVNEENAAGGRVVTAPTNGAAGIIPAVLHYYDRMVPGADADGIVRFLLAAAAVGSLCKRNASISGAEVGCQGEVGSASAMAAAGLAEVMGGTPEQVENAAEIAMEHNLGLTCDPIGGLVQIPCIERNAIAAVKAIAAARLALKGDGEHRVSLDKVIRTMRDTGADMSDKYKETARGGLAVNLVEC
jgi:L-serine dehydratase